MKKSVTCLVLDPRDTHIFFSEVLKWYFWDPFVTRLGRALYGHLFFTGMKPHRSPASEGGLTSLSSSRSSDVYDVINHLKMPQTSLGSHLFPAAYSKLSKATWDRQSVYTQRETRLLKM